MASRIYPVRLTASPPFGGNLRGEYLSPAFYSGADVKRANPEQILHEQCVLWLRAAHPKLLFWHTANESKSRPQYRAKLSRMGLQAGVPDLTFLFPGGRIAFVEFKSAKGRLSAAQEAFYGAAAVRGAIYVVVRDFDSFRNLIATWTQHPATVAA